MTFPEKQWGLQDMVQPDRDPESLGQFVGTRECPEPTRTLSHGEGCWVWGMVSCGGQHARILAQPCCWETRAPTYSSCERRLKGQGHNCSCSTVSEGHGIWFEKRLRGMTHEDITRGEAATCCPGVSARLAPALIFTQLSLNNPNGCIWSN